MINTLKITGIIIAVLAVAVLVLLVLAGLKPDPQIEQFLKTPGIIESLKAKSDNTTKNRSQTSPLVKQAQAFAALINPPKITRTINVPKSGSKPAPIPAVRPKTVSAKFKLIGTCYYPMNQQMSWALLDQVGEGLKWAKKSGKSDTS